MPWFIAQSAASSLALPFAEWHMLGKGSRLDDSGGYKIHHYRINEWLGWYDVIVADVVADVVDVDVDVVVVIIINFSSDDTWASLFYSTAGSFKNLNIISTNFLLRHSISLTARYINYQRLDVTANFIARFVINDFTVKHV